MSFENECAGTFTVSSTLRLYAVALLTIVEERRHCCIRKRKQLNPTRNDIVFLEVRENASAKVANCLSGCWEYRIQKVLAQLCLGNVQSAARGIW